MSNENGQINDSKEYFDIKKAYEYFRLTLLDNDDIHIGSYLEAYKELCKFCTLLGSVFSFVATEITSKSETMHELRKNCQEEHFDSLKKMIDYEKGSQLLSDKSYVSGCRTLLRLHRGLDFIRTFLRRIAEIELEGSTSHIGTESYHDTLGKYHGWFIRQGAFLAMKFLPKKKTILTSVCGSQFEQVEEVLPLMLEAADEVYKRTQECYEVHELLDLP